MPIITLLYGLLKDYVLLCLWLIPFALWLYHGVKARNYKAIMIANVCLGFVFYFIWAISGVWSKHEVAVVFNRLAHVSAIILLTWLILIIRSDNGQGLGHGLFKNERVSHLREQLRGWYGRLVKRG